MIDDDGYRPNVGIVLTNNKQQVLLAKRYKQDAWQLPQGGVDENEAVIDALFRELSEEIGLSSEHVVVLARTPKWLRYKLPKHLIRHSAKPTCIGQKQVWFLLKLISSEINIRLDTHNKPEFDDWEWIDYWQPIDRVIDFKMPVYEDMLKALAPVLFDNQHKVPSQYSRPLKCSAILMKNSF
jgi:putative (di)nucleoside polyphosphate hydrolase